jgi:two-component sensor histidine kinase
MALVHEKLYQSKDLSSVNFSEYIKNLSSYIANSFNSDSRKIRIIYNFEEIHLSIEKAVPLGLILNELLSNCYKYAFPNSQQLNKSNENTIKISFNLVKESDRINFSVKDNGVGIPKDLVVLESDTLGLQLVNNLVDQLEADLTINNSDGTEFNISFLHQKK